MTHDHPSRPLVRPDDGESDPALPIAQWANRHVLVNGRSSTGAYDARMRRLSLSDLEVMAQVHVRYEAESLVAPFFVPSSSPWIDNVRLEVVMIHVRCLYAFLTGIGARASDVLASHYFDIADAWTPPGVVIGTTP